MNNREAVTGFAAWLTTRPGALKLGSAHNASWIAWAAGEYCEANGFPPVSEDWATMPVVFPNEEFADPGEEVPDAVSALIRAEVAAATKELRDTVLRLELARFKDGR